MFPGQPTPTLPGGYDDSVSPGRAAGPPSARRPSRPSLTCLGPRCSVCRPSGAGVRVVGSDGRAGGRDGDGRQCGTSRPRRASRGPEEHHGTDDGNGGVTDGPRSSVPPAVRVRCPGRRPVDTPREGAPALPPVLPGRRGVERGGTRAAVVGRPVRTVPQGRPCPGPGALETDHGENDHGVVTSVAGGGGHGRGRRSLARAERRRARGGAAVPLRACGVGGARPTRPRGPEGWVRPRRRLPPRRPDGSLPRTPPQWTLGTPRTMVGRLGPVRSGPRTGSVSSRRGTGVQYYPPFIPRPTAQNPDPDPTSPTSPVGRTPRSECGRPPGGIGSQSPTRTTTRVHRGGGADPWKPTHPVPPRTPGPCGAPRGRGERL